MGKRSRRERPRAETTRRAPGVEPSPPPAAEEKPAAEAQVAREEKPAAEAQVAEEKPTAEERPRVEEKPTAEERPRVEEKPAEERPRVEKPAEERPRVEVKPAEERPRVEAKRAEERPRVEAKPAEERPRAVASHGLGAFLLHLHPRLVRRRTLTLRATLGLGLATLVSLGLVTLTGLLLLVHYVPSVERAHASLQELETLVPLGAFLRRLHRYSGHAAVLFALLHLARALLWGAYRGAHRRVWLLGALLLLTTLATSYSGYLLPWDQDAYWTVTVGSSLFRYLPFVGEPLRDLMLGASEVGQPALTRFFVLHVVALPALGLLLLVLHLFRLRRAGGLARAPGAAGPGEELVPAAPELVRRELALSLLVLLGLLLVALPESLPLGPAPDLARPDNPPKAPWFFVGLQELVSYSASFGGVLFPLLLAGLLLFLPWLDGGERGGGEPLAERGAALAIPAATALVAATAILGLRWWGDPQAGASSWLNPASLAALAALGVALLAALRHRSRALGAQALLAGLLVALLVFTLAGWFWRGPDWALLWHPGPGRGLP